jgi:hypothetical protein
LPRANSGRGPSSAKNLKGRHKSRIKKRKSASQQDKEKLFELHLLDLEKPYKSKLTRAERYRRNKQIKSQGQEDEEALLKKSTLAEVAATDDLDTFPDNPKAPKDRSVKSVLVQDEDEQDELVKSLSVHSGWRRKYLETLVSTGDRNQAIKKCGNPRVNAITIERACDPKNDGYDPVFAEAIEDLEKKLIWQIEDNFLGNAKRTGDNSDMVLRSRMRSKYSDKIPESSGPVINNYWFNQTAEHEAVDILKNLFPDRPPLKEVTDASPAGDKGSNELAATDSSAPELAAKDSGSVPASGAETESGESDGKSPRHEDDGVVGSLLSLAVHPADEGVEASGKRPAILLAE